MKILLCGSHFVVAACWLIAVAPGQQNGTDPRPAEKIAVDKTSPTKSQPAGRRNVLIVCGHPGDTAHEIQFAESIGRLHAGLTSNFGVRKQDVTTLFGEVDSPIRDGGSKADWMATAPACTRETLQTAVQKLENSLQPADELWVFVIGHSNHDRGKTWFNLVGPDIHQDDFAMLFAKTKAGRQLFFVTIPASGFYIRPLSRAGRIIVTATEADLEINETLFPHSLAETISDRALIADIDKDNRTTVFDLYLAATKRVAERYAADGFISTEHALLDDNGDKRGSEIQKHFLTEDLGGLPERRQRRTLRTGADGPNAKAFEL